MNINMQPSTKINHNCGDGNLFVHSCFKTIQGEGPFSGEPAVFLRLGGCNLQCPMCDTEYTRNAELLRVNEIVEAMIIPKLTPNRLVVITGGEPFRQNITELVNLLIRHCIRVQIETNGTIFLKGFPYGAVTIVCSPKTGKVAKELQTKISAYKYVLSADSYCEKDGLPIKALGHPANPRLFRPPEGYRGPIYLQPADEQVNSLNRINTRITLTLCKKFGYTFCFQIHKHVGEE